MSIDIVVVNYHTPRDLQAFMDSLGRHPPKTNATLTVVDVAVEPDDYDFRWCGRPGHQVGVADNIGYARACNHGASLGGHDVIAFFNADIELTAGALDACHDALVANDDWGVVGPRQVDDHNRLRHAGIFGTHAAPAHRAWGRIDRGQYNETADAVTVSGSAYFVKRSVWDELSACSLYRAVAPDAQGAFLPTPHYYEETWCSYHAWAHGHRVIYFGPVAIIHKWHRASPVGGWAERQLPISRAYFRKACAHHRIPHD